MKKVLLAAIALPLLVACGQEIKNENIRLTGENEQLSADLKEQEQQMDDFIATFTQIQDNLAQIREREESIQQATDGEVEGAGNAQDRVLSDIESINELLNSNKTEITELTDKIGRYSYEVGKFKKMVSTLNTEIEVKDKQVLELKEDLASMNFEMTKLNSKLEVETAANREKTAVIKAQKESLNTAFYTVGTFKELNSNKVLDKKGGVIGIGRTKALADDFNKDYFTRIDISKTAIIPINSDDDDVKLVSSHPTDSYKWNKQDDQVVSLEITNAKKFWKSSKYLVVLVD